MDDFHKSIESTISSKPNKKYSYQILKLKGEVNDTIHVRPCEDCKTVKLTGKINQKFMNFFKEGKSIIRFDPYKATDGDLKLTHKIR